MSRKLLNIDGEDPLNDLMVGGNHLASVLIGRLGSTDDKFPPYRTSIEKAGEILAGENLDLWICWRQLMLYRDYMRDLA